MNLSILIPLLNEEESLQELHDWIAKVMQSNRYLYEIIFIDDGSTDTSWQVIEKLSSLNKSVKGIRFQRNFGKSQALDAGFKLKFNKLGFIFNFSACLFISFNCRAML